jgi:hypothetical protein
LLKQICIGVSDVISFGGAHGGGGGEGMIVFLWRGPRRRRRGRLVFFGGDQGGGGGDGKYFLAGTKVAEGGRHVFSFGVDHGGEGGDSRARPSRTHENFQFYENSIFNFVMSRCIFHFLGQNTTNAIWYTIVH